jgi:hypothetical protein
MKNRWKYLIALLLVLIIAAGVYFFFSANNKKSPEYSLTLLQTAITSHDWAAVQKRMDMNTFYGQVFDDVIAPTMRPTNYGFANEFFSGILQNVKTTFVSSMTEYTKEFITKDSTDKTPPLPEQAFASKFIGIINLKNATYKKCSNVKIQGDTSTADITITDKTLGKDFLIQVSMKKLPDETWQLVKVLNITDLLSNIKKAQAEKLVALNKPLSEEIASQISISKGDFDIKTRQSPWQSTAFIYKPLVTFKSDEQITAFIGQVQVLGKNNDALFTQKYIVTGPFPIGAKQDYSFSWTLNPFVPGEKALIEANKNDLKIKETILGVKLENGKNLQILEQMPESN